MTVQQKKVYGQVLIKDYEAGCETVRRRLFTEMRELLEIFVSISLEDD